MKTHILFAACLLCGPLLAHAQDKASITLPAGCTAGAEGRGTTPAAGHTMPALDRAHQDLMKDMDAMNVQMMKGMMAKDADLAFVCGMIAHHQGAISMARAQLQHGDDGWAKDKAQKIIADQEKEVKEMVEWVSKQTR